MIYTGILRIYYLESRHYQLVTGDKTYALVVPADKRHLRTQLESRIGKLISIEGSVFDDFSVYYAPVIKVKAIVG